MQWEGVAGEKRQAYRRLSSENDESTLKTRTAFSYRIPVHPHIPFRYGNPSYPRKSYF